MNIDSYKDLAELLGNTKNRLTIRNLCDILLFRDIALQDAKYGNAESGYMKRIWRSGLTDPASRHNRSKHVMCGDIKFDFCSCAFCAVFLLNQTSLWAMSQNISQGGFFICTKSFKVSSAPLRHPRF